MRRDRRRRPYDPTLSSVLLFLGVLALVISGRAIAQTAAGTFSTVFGQVQIQRAGVTIGAASGVGVNVWLEPEPACPVIEVMILGCSGWVTSNTQKPDSQAAP